MPTENLRARVEQATLDPRPQPDWPVLISDLWAEVERLTYVSRRYTFWAEVSTDPSSGWCSEHPRRVEASTAGMVGWDPADGDDLCLACALRAAWAERDADRKRSDDFNALIDRCWEALGPDRYAVSGIVPAIEALRADRDALRTAAADREHPLHAAVRQADANYRETGRGAAELDAANLAWTQAGCPLEVEITADDMARVTAERDAARKERDALAARRVVTVCAEHGDVLSAETEDDDGDLLVTAEPCSRCTQNAFRAGHARATGRNP